jgi:plasmid stabilization system protein ParE
MTELLVRPEAEVDAFEAASWYEREREGLGSAFLARVRRVFKRIESGPLQFPLVMADIRRALLGRFPFGVFFFVDDQAAVVIAIMHLHRHPDSWEDRR